MKDKTVIKINKITGDTVFNLLAIWGGYDETNILFSSQC